MIITIRQLHYVILRVLAYRSTKLAGDVGLPVKDGGFNVAGVNLIIEGIVGQISALSRTGIVSRAEVRIRIYRQHYQDNDE